MRRRLKTIWFVLFICLFVVEAIMEAVTERRMSGLITVWLVAGAVVAVCAIAIVVIAVRTKRRTGLYPKELTWELPKEEEMSEPGVFFLLVFGMLAASGLGLLGRIPALRTPLGFVAPGMGLAALTAFVGCILAYSFKPEFRTWRIVRWQTLMLIGASAFAASLYYLSIRSLLPGPSTPADWASGELSCTRLALALFPGLRAAVVWAVAVVEACILAPLLVRLSLTFSDGN